MTRSHPLSNCPLTLANSNEPADRYLVRLLLSQAKPLFLWRARVPPSRAHAITRSEYTEGNTTSRILSPQMSGNTASSTDAAPSAASGAADSGGPPPVVPARTNSNPQNTPAGRFRQRRQSKSERIDEILQVSRTKEKKKKGRAGPLCNVQRAGAPGHFFSGL